MVAIKYFSEFERSESIKQTDNHTILQFHLFPNRKWLIKIRINAKRQADSLIKYPSLYNNENVSNGEIEKYPISTKY